MSQDWQEPFNEGMAYGSAGRYTEAADSFRRAIVLGPEEPYPHYELGYTLSLLGRHDEALEEFTLTESLKHGFFLVQTEIYICERVITGEIDPDAHGWLRELQKLTDMGASDSPQATSIARKVIRRAPGLPLGHFYLGKSLFPSSPREAEQALERCVELGPDETTDIDARGHLVVILRNEGRDADARTLLRSIMEDHAGHPLLAIVKKVLPAEGSE